MPKSRLRSPWEVIGIPKTNTENSKVSGYGGRECHHVHQESVFTSMRKHGAERHKFPMSLLLSLGISWILLCGLISPSLSFSTAKLKGSVRVNKEVDWVLLWWNFTMSDSILSSFYLGFTCRSIHFLSRNGYFPHSILSFYEMPMLMLPYVWTGWAMKNCNHAIPSSRVFNAYSLFPSLSLSCIWLWTNYSSWINLAHRQ